jgi:small-conductance mechanosensitive channel
MQCPFCAEDIKDEALVCKHCSRDLKIPKPLIEENQELIATIGELQQELNKLRADLARHRTPGAFWATHLAVYIVPPIALLLLAHLLLIVKFDVNPLVMRGVSMLIPLPFGFALAWFAYLGLRTAACVGIAIGVIAVAGMTAIIGYTDNVPIMPQNVREWRETIEYALSIALATVTGNILATMARNLLAHHVSGSIQPSAMAMRVAMLIGPHVGKQALRRRAEKVEGLLNTMGSIGGVVGSAAGTVYTGVRAVIGM